MITTPLSEVARHIGAKIVGGDFDVSKVYTDSRNKNLDGLFIALKGPHFDAHRFVNSALESGAKGLLVDHQCDTDRPQVIVENTHTALADLARLNRSKSEAKFVGITGSSGKTTVKEMVAAILQLSGKTLATKGNFNNDIGVPLTLLDIGEEVDFGVIEMGANHSGEIAYTADITRPDVALVNNVSAAHLEGFGDLHGVASAKSEIYSALTEDGIAIVNKDDEFFDFFEKKINSQKITFSMKSTADVMAKNIRLNKNQSSVFELNHLKQKVEVELPVVGLHNISNALAAASCCIALNISLSQIATGLKMTPVVSGRLMISKLKSGCRIIDDTYNANLASMKAAIDLLKNYSSPKILVLGDMAELGEYGRESHEQIGAYAGHAGIDQLYTCGVLTQFLQTAFEKIVSDHKGEHFSQQNELIKKLKKEAIAGATILIKGSRSAHMEKVIQALMEDSEIVSNDQAVSASMDKSAASLQGEK